jgi:hypothetical protein
MPVKSIALFVYCNCNWCVKKQVLHQWLLQIILYHLLNVL